MSSLKRDNVGYNLILSVSKEREWGADMLRGVGSNNNNDDDDARLHTHALLCAAERAAMRTLHIKH